jgi:hypothetical protein
MMNCTPAALKAVPSALKLTLAVVSGVWDIQTKNFMLKKPRIFAGAQRYETVGKPKGRLKI